jgi:predicted transcriptional regulator
MSPPGLKQIVKHDGRLNLLSCLVANGPLSASGLATRTGDSLQAVSYWLRLLDTFDLVEETEAENQGEVVYSATLDGHPDWVRETVEQHRPRAI